MTIRKSTILKKAAALAVALAAAAARGDCLDELMPRPRIIHRGSGDISATHAAHEGGYTIHVRRGKPEVSGDAEGRRYARATLFQLAKLSGGAGIPDCTIIDWPEFKYRGLMLDCGRNWQSVESIKDVISMLAAYKFNVFHWHLTDDCGWRLESKKHPELRRKEAFSRHPGKFYTQAEFTEVVRFAAVRGVTVIPELDMPGHTLAFRKATGIADLADEKAKTILGELIDELCSLAGADAMPIIHLGTDEARERGEKVPQSHLDYWAARVAANGRKVMGWSPGQRLPGQAVKQLWMGASDPRGDKTPYIDSQNSYYINHVDPEELLSVAAYQQPCRWGGKDEKLGAAICVWHDDAIAETEDVVRMNAVYPAIVLLSDNFWRGREKDEPGLYARLPPPDDPRFALAADLERRTIAQRDKVLKGFRHPFPYVAQTSMRWRMTDAGGTVLAADIPQATVYPRHFWFPGGAYAPWSDGTVVLETWIESERDVDCGAWIGMTGFSRSDGRKRDAPAPKLGEWNKHGATVELNGEKIEPPRWAHPGIGGNPKETPLVDEDYWYRPPARIRLKKGVNHVKMTLPKRGGWKWIGTFVPVAGTSDHPREVEGLSYSSAAPEDRRIKVACIGDSITYGYGLADRANESYPAQLQRMLDAKEPGKYEVRNFGNSGRGVYLDSMRGQEKRGFRYMPEHKSALGWKPDVVVCNLGINDCGEYIKEYTGGRRRGQFLDDYSALLEDYRKANANAKFFIWTKLSPLAEGQKFYRSPEPFLMQADLEAAARRFDATGIDMQEPLREKMDGIFERDKIHPDAEGARIIAERTFAAMREASDAGSVDRGGISRLKSGVPRRGDSGRPFETWLCAGQSNMQKGWGEFNATPAEKERVQGEMARLARVDVRFWDFNTGEWTKLTPQSALRKSAFGVSFAIRRAEATGKTVFMLYVAAGGAPTESFLSEQTMCAAGKDGKPLYPHLAAIATNRHRLDRNKDFPCAWVAREYPRRRNNMDEGHWWPVSLMYDSAIKRIKESGIQIDGILWYQGESNATTCVAPDAPTPRDYQLETLRALVAELRGGENIPFIMMGLPKMNRPWEQYRDVQRQVCGETGAVYVDTFAAGLGDPSDVHPRDKIPFAEMAARAAAAHN